MGPTPPTSLKLTYFDFPGLAEPIRLAFHLGDVPFEDYRMPREEWMGPNGKASMPLGLMPVLTIDGKVYPQSSAILRYASKLAGLVPEDLEQQLLVDVCVATAEEALTTVQSSMRESDPERKKEKRKAIVTEYFPKLFNGLSKLITEHNATPGFAVGSSTTIADLMIFNLVWWIARGIIDDIPADTFEAYPVIHAIHKRVVADSKVKAYYEKTPQSVKLVW
eukprot:TRINITY_DN24007_c0_g1_i1.p1 TRINITY_DN24007_c0_g1~~TRINITY_DN24007_c0_g1_i1.p1  ORF type:complete len:221 (+),score=40.99 TRINITY_DN24007_c0_g1_i1:183-845(+)